MKNPIEIYRMRRGRRLSAYAKLRFRFGQRLLLCLPRSRARSDEKHAKTVLLFRNEESIGAFKNDFALAGWEFFETENAIIPGFAFMNEAVYTVSCIDQNGAPVPGGMLQICDETSCRVAQTDANGMHTFTSAPCAWEVHVLIAPNGYTASDESFMFPKAGGEFTLTLRKN